MVVKMMRWRPWPSKKFHVKIVLHRLQGLSGVASCSRLMVEIKWKGPKFTLRSLRRSVKTNFTKEGELTSDGDDDGVVEWNEEFQNLCNLTGNLKENVFHPWEITFTVLFIGSNQKSKNKLIVAGTALLNLAEYASVDSTEIDITVPITVPGTSSEHHPLLCLSLNIVEVRTTSQDSSETIQRSIVAVTMPPRPGEALTPEKDELSVLKAGLRKVKIFKDYVSAQRAKKAFRAEEDSVSRDSARTEDGESTCPFDTESPDDFEEEEWEDNEEELVVRKSFGYGSLAHANCAGEKCYSEMRMNGEYEDWVYYSNRISDAGCLRAEDTPVFVSDQYLSQSSKRSILSWRKRKLSFRSPKAKGEPLLKKAYAEEGGDDIDFDRRQLNSSDESFALGWHEGSTTNRSSISEFGDDNFAIGSWEHKEVVSRDGQMKLLTQVFFASIDQRSECAAGESACTALVAVIADWFQTNQDIMPIKSQFHSLIRDGSLEWRNLCEVETYMEQFHDKHFDLDTVLRAKIRPLTVASEKSFIGFFHPDGMDEGSGFDFLHGAMSFDNIWDEISRIGSECQSNSEPQVYIVSWNDHFFVLKVEAEAYYIIDTLGERLYEGCNQAYILKFDKDTIIEKTPNESKSSAEIGKADPQIVSAASMARDKPVEEPSKRNDAEVKEEEEVEVVCKGKECCKEYIKSFLAAIPIRELQVDIRRGLIDSTPLHHRLQIEFHYTEFLQPEPPVAVEAAEEFRYTGFLQPEPPVAVEAAEEFHYTGFLQPEPPVAVEAAVVTTTEAILAAV